MRPKRTVNEPRYEYECPVCGKPFFYPVAELPDGSMCPRCQSARRREEKRKSWWSMRSGLHGARLVDVDVNEFGDLEALILKAMDQTKYRVEIDLGYEPCDTHLMVKKEDQ